MAWKDYVFGTEESISYLIDNYQFETIFDFGCGEAPYIDKFLKSNKKFSAIDAFPTDFFEKFKDDNRINLIDGNFMNYDFSSLEKFDCVFSSHVVEHVANTEDFLKLKLSLLKDNGIFCIMWPKPKRNIVGGHVHVFSPGLMFYNLIRLGVDCRNCEILDCDYTYTIVGHINRVKIDLVYDMEEYPTIQKYFPFPAPFGFDGSNISTIKKLQRNGKIMYPYPPSI